MNPRLLLLVSFFALGLAAAPAAVLTNADVIKMTRAGLDEAVILVAIEHCDLKLDTSPPGLIALSEASVPAGVIGAMIRRAQPAAPVEKPAQEAPRPVAAAPEPRAPLEVVLLGSDGERPLRYTIPGLRSKARALGLGGVAAYAVLPGGAATERVATPQPSFLVAVPNQSRVESHVTIGNLAVRDNGTREILIAGGGMSFSLGLPPERVVAYTTSRLEDQSRAPAGYTLYRISPARPLAPGEYALILNTAQVQVSGQAMAMPTNGMNAYFDFGL